MKECPSGSHIIIKSNPIFPVEILLMSTRYKYNYQKVLIFIANEGAGGTVPGDTYLYCFPDTSSNVSIYPVVCTCMICKYFNAFKIQ